MKRLIFILLLFVSIIGFTQEENTEPADIHQNEISINLIDLISAGAVELQYERFLPQNQALQFNLTLFDNYGYWELDNIEKSSAHSILAAYKFYMGKREHHGVFFYPFVKYMFGSLELSEPHWFIDRDSEISEFDVDNFSVGFGFGYKWLFADKFTLGLDFNLGRTFNNELADIYSRVEYKPGISFGMRF